MSHYWMKMCIIVLVTSLLTGCWDRHELNKLGLAIAVGIDWEDEQWKLSYQVLVPSVIGGGMSPGAASGGAAVHVISTQGKTVREASMKTSLENTRRLYFAHTDVMIIGEEAARHGIHEFLDLLFRINASRESVIVALTDGKASDLIRKLVLPEKYPGIALTELIRQTSTVNSDYPTVRVYQLAQKITSESHAAGVPVIMAGQQADPVLESEEESKKTSTSGAPKIVKLGVFQRDRLIGWLSREESQGLAWLTNQFKMGTISIPVSTRAGGYSSFRILRSKSRIKPIPVGDHFKMQVTVELKGELLEYGGHLDLKSPDSLRPIEREVEKKVAYMISRSWEGSRRLKADLPGFADEIHRHYPKKWRQLSDHWDNELAALDLDVQVKAKMKRPGLLNKSFEQLLPH